MRRPLVPAALIAALLAVLLAVVLAPLGGPATARTPLADPVLVSADAVTLTGYDFVTDRPVPVTAGEPDNRLVLTYVAGEPLADGTVTLDVPRAAWRTPLTALAPGVSLLQDDRGAVAARPVPPQQYEPDDCTGVDGSTLQWVVQQLPRVQRIVVAHVDCAAGSSLEIRLNGVTPPRRGRYSLPVRVTDALGVRLDGRAPISVVAPARTRLELRIPAGPFEVDRPFAAAVVALRPNGTIDRGYLGEVGFAPVDLDFCGFVSQPGRTYTFTAADRGVLVLTFDFGLPTRPGQESAMTVRAIDRGARPDTSAAYTVVQVEPPDVVITCNPVSFH